VAGITKEEELKYDPELDEPRYSEREVAQIVGEILLWAKECGELQQEKFRLLLPDMLSDIPMQIYGDWEADRVYPVQAVVYHGGDRWLSLAETSGEPGKGPWRRLHPTTNTNTPPRAA
jgi:hypothetical protein